MPETLNYAPPESGLDGRGGRLLLRILTMVSLLTCGIIEIFNHAAGSPLPLPPLPSDGNGRWHVTNLAEGNLQLALAVAVWWLYPLVIVLVFVYLRALWRASSNGARLRTLLPAAILLAQWILMFRHSYLDAMFRAID